MENPSATSSSTAAGGAATPGDGYGPDRVQGRDARRAGRTRDTKEMPTDIAVQYGPNIGNSGNSGE
ncbi:hypothetical protein I546_3394 [Mycobacterium kansasii 732]|nr:hypothetical protein I546_3394 [Mycobacterium kansasii 732]